MSHENQKEINETLASKARELASLFLSAPSAGVGPTFYPAVVQGDMK
jgi:hypothetical protein